MCVHIQRKLTSCFQIQVQDAPLELHVNKQEVLPLLNSHWQYLTSNFHNKPYWIGGQLMEDRVIVISKRN